VLESSRARISRLTPAQAADAWRAGAVVVDIRPAAQRESEGALPGALVIERNILEWRFDPSSDARLPIADYELQVIVVCQEGYTPAWPLPRCKTSASTVRPMYWRARRLAQAALKVRFAARTRRGAVQRGLRGTFRSISGKTSPGRDRFSK
jgi:hypothetical protein